MSTQLKKYFSNLGQFVSNPSKLCPQIAELSQQLHTNIREQEIQYGLTKPKAALQQLYLDGMDHDQIFEQLAANDDDLLSLEEPGNLCMQVSDLKVAAEADVSRYQLLADAPLTAADSDEDSGGDSALSDDEGMEQDDEDDSEQEDDDEGAELDASSSSLDEGVADGGSASEGEEEEEEEGDNTQSDVGTDEDSDDEGKEDDKSDDSDDDVYEDLDAQLFEKYMKKSDSEDEGNESECGDLAMGSEGESDEEDGEDNQNTDEEKDDNDDSEEKQSDDEPSAKRSKQVDSKPNAFSNPLSSISVPGFTKTKVDSGFFNVRESEWIADEDIIGANNFDDIDFMEDIESGDEQATYKDFFDDGPPTSSKKKSKKRKGDAEQLSDEAGDDDGADDWGVEEDEEEEEQQRPEAEGRTAPNTAQESQSRLEAELSAEARLREQLEESNIAAKPWELRGEVKAQDRPTNSVLTQYLEYRSGARYRPELNEDLTRRLEKIAVDRFRTRAFDSVERKAKIVDNPFEFKKKIVLEQEKSTKSLSKIYEEEYLKKQKSDDARESGEEEAQFKKLRAEFTEIQELLRALSNAHYTPKMSQAEVKIVSNQPALRVEEATPLVVGDADMLAPQEILAPARGEVKGDTEKTTTDRKRERRTKKHLQHLKHQRQEEKTNEKVKKAAKLGKKLDKDTSSNVVKKALKIGSVKMMDNKGDNVKGFFKQMNEISSKASNKPTNKRKRDSNN